MMKRDKIPGSVFSTCKLVEAAFNWVMILIWLKVKIMKCLGTAFLKQRLLSPSTCSTGAFLALVWRHAALRQVRVTFTCSLNRGLSPISRFEVVLVNTPHESRLQPTSHKSLTSQHQRVTSRFTWRHACARWKSNIVIIARKWLGASGSAGAKCLQMILAMSEGCDVNKQPENPCVTSLAVDRR